MSKYKIKGPFVGRTREMLKSPAFRSLSLTALRLLARIEIEHMNHGGGDNGRLPVTYANFVAYGIEHKALPRGIRELEALGFTEITQRGRAGNAEYHMPNKFRLTYLPTQNGDATNDWKSIASVADAEHIAAKARSNPHPKKGGGNGLFPRPLKGVRSRPLKGVWVQAPKRGHQEGEITQAPKRGHLYRTSTHIGAVWEGQPAPTPAAPAPANPKSQKRNQASDRARRLRAH